MLTPHRRIPVVELTEICLTDGPVLSQTDLYLLRDIQLEIHPVLANIDEGFQLNFDLSTGKQCTSRTIPSGILSKARLLQKLLRTYLRSQAWGRS